MSGYVGAAVASAAAGILWIAAWLHLMAAHGGTDVKERKLVLGLTWLDSGRLIAPSLALAGFAFWLLAAWYGHTRLRRAATNDNSSAVTFIAPGPPEVPDTDPCQHGPQA